MAEDWLVDVKKYVPNADETAVAGIVRYCGIALRNRDSSLVSFTDKTETDRVRNNFLKKKLARTEPDDVLDQAIAAVGERMKADHTKNRVTVYYLLAEHFGQLALFHGKAKAGELEEATEGDSDHIGGAAIAASAGAAGLAALGGASVAGAEIPPSGTGGGSTGGSRPGTPRPLADIPESGGGSRWWLWALLALLALLILFFLLRSCKPQDAGMAPLNTVEANVSGAGTDTLGNLSDMTDNVSDVPVAVPTGAGVSAATINNAPALKVYFDKGKSDVTNDFSTAATKLTAYLSAHPGASLAVSGYNDPSGNAAFNAELSKHRAQQVAAALKAAGVPDSAVTLVKPSNTTISSTDPDAARRVEVTVKQ
jgi:outer membrane protein OmpA-like peptidoglycan-associated protein